MKPIEKCIKNPPPSTKKKRRTLLLIHVKTNNF